MLPPKIDTITHRVCRAYNVSPISVRSGSRQPEFCRARHVIIYAALTVGYNPEIVSSYFGRSRAVVYASKKAAVRLIGSNSMLKRILEDTLYAN